MERAPTALVLLADGCEEIEALTIVDVLRRGGVSVTIATIGSAPTVRGAHGIVFEADALARPEVLNPAAWDLVALPGGMGCMTALRTSTAVADFLRAMDAAGRFVSAICASPVVLGAAGLLKGHRYVCYPGMHAQIADGAYDPTAKAVCDGNVITGSGPGTATAFALALLEALRGPSVRDEVAHGWLAE